MKCEHCKLEKELRTFVLEFGKCEKENIKDDWEDDTYSWTGYIKLCQKCEEELINFIKNYFISEK